MAACSVDDTKSPQFDKLRRRWKRDFPNIDSDLSEAFAAISKDITACKARRYQSGRENTEIYKYRQNSKDVRRGQNYGWRIYALYDKKAGVMYPIIVYPKTEW